VRVSVVATGIDIAMSAVQPAPRTVITQAVAPMPAPQAVAAASRLAELTQSLRVSTQRMAERTIEQGHRAVAQALSIAPMETAEQPHAEFEPLEAPAPAPAPITAIEDVTIRPITPKPTLFVEQAAEEHVEAAPPLAAPEKPFIPPQAERPLVRAPRMPRIDELPIPAQNQIRARQAEAAGTPEKPRQSLLQRLASVGLGRREEEARPAAPAPAPVAQRMAPPMPKAPPMPPLAPQALRPESISEYAKRPVIQRPAPQGLDHHGRPAPVHNSVEDDQLEIPAFLRRQAN
jgi:cell division protein FtsZ